MEKDPKNVPMYEDVESLSLKQEEDTLARDLKDRHITMIAIGGAIGTGLTLGTGSVLMKAGPGSLFLSYTFIGSLVFLTLNALGEVAAFLPTTETFVGYATRFIDPAVGWAFGWSYVIKFYVSTANQFVASALIMSYWLDLNPGVWITIFIAVCVAVNLLGVKYFGEFEFWLSSIKVITILGLLLCLLVIMLGGAPDHDRRGFRYWNNPGAFNNWTGVPGGKGRFVAFVSSLVNSVFAYLSSELVGMTVGETSNPRRAIGRAVKLTFYRIVVFYVFSVLLLGTCVAYNDPLLAESVSATTSAAASPFVVAIFNAKITGLDHVLNAAFLLFALSAANTDYFVSSRALFSLAEKGHAPKIFLKTHRNLPINCLILSFITSALAYMACSTGSRKAFTYLVNFLSMYGLLSWITIQITHIRFRKALVAQNVPLSELPYRSVAGVPGTIFALTLCIVVALIKNFTVFIGHGPFDWRTFLTGYLALPVYIIMIFGYKFVMKTKMVDPLEADLITGKQRGIELEQAAEERKAAQSNLGGLRGFYHNFLGLIF